MIHETQSDVLAEIAATLREIRDELAKREPRQPEPVRCETCRDDPRGIDQRLGGRGAAMLNGWTPCPDCAPPRQPEAGVGSEPYYDGDPMHRDALAWILNALPHIDPYDDEAFLVDTLLKRYLCVIREARRLLAPRLTDRIVNALGNELATRGWIIGSRDLHAALLAVGYREDK